MTGQDLNAGLAVAAGTVLVLTLLGTLIRSRLWLSQALVCLIVGIAVGPAGFGLVAFDPLADEAHLFVLEQTARLTISLSVMGAALRLPEGFVRRHAVGLALVLTAGMAAMWGASTAIGLAFGMAGLTAMMIGAIVSPTDPVLAASIVRGRLADEHVTERTRHAITAESAINDGLGLPFVLLPILLLTGTEGGPWGHFLGHVVLWEVLAAAGLGALIGTATGWLFAWAQDHGTCSERATTAVTLALTLATVATVKLMGADGILAVFTAGIAFDRFLVGEHDTRSEHFEEAVDRFFTLPVFILLGAALPWAAWRAQGWAVLGVAACVLLFRRLPAFALAGPRLPLYGSARTARFVGWFGPIGVAAIFYAMLAVRRTGEPSVWTYVSAIVAGSIVVHGVSATPFTRRYGDRK